MAKLSHKFFAIASLLTLMAPASPSFAQAQPCPCMTNAICCQCADGSSRSVDISTGIAPWRVTRPHSNTSELAIGAGGNGASIWHANLPGAQWIVPPGTYAFAAPGNYTYTLQYWVPDCVIVQPVITVQFASDDGATISGTTLSSSGFNATNIPAHILPASFSTPGAHVLTIVVNNGSSPTGLLVKATMTTTCPRQQ